MFDLHLLLEIAGTVAALAGVLLTCMDRFGVRSSAIIVHYADPALRSAAFLAVPDQRVIADRRITVDRRQPDGRTTDRRRQTNGRRSTDRLVGVGLQSMVPTSSAAGVVRTLAP